MSTWRHYELGFRIRRTDGSGEEILGLDRRSGRPVTLRLYPTVQRVALPPALVEVTSSPHLASPIELSEESGETVAVRDLAFGPSFADLLAEGALPEQVVFALLTQLLGGLAALHRQGLTHLRLSPSAVRFDLLSGALKIIDLEERYFDLEPPAELVPRFLDPRLREGAEGPACDVYSAGRLGEALLRGGSPLGSWGVRPVQTPGGSLWEFIQRCQAPVDDDRPIDAVVALEQLGAVRFRPPPSLSLPIGSFVRRHVRGLRQLRRWRAQPLAALAETPTAAYRESRSAASASRAWGAVAVGGLASLALTAAVAVRPSPGTVQRSTFPADACVAAAQPTVLGRADPVPAGRELLEMAVPAGAAIAIDGCPVEAPADQPGRFAVAPGAHAVRVRGSPPAESPIQPSAHPTAEPSTPLESLLQAWNQQAEAGRARKSPLSPIDFGFLSPLSRQLLDAEQVAFQAGGSQAHRDLPDEVGLALDGLVAARRRFQAEEVPCEAKLSAGARRELGRAGLGDPAANAVQAVELLTVTRLHGPAMVDPLQVEKAGLEQLGVQPSPALLTAVEQLVADSDVAQCLEGLTAAAEEVEQLAALTVRQIPGLAQQLEPAIAPGSDDDPQ